MKEQLFFFFISGPGNSNFSSLKVPEIKTLQAQSHVLVTSNLDDDDDDDDDSDHQSKMTKLAWRHHIPILNKSVGYFQTRKGS